MIRTVASLTAAAVLYAFTSALAQAPESAPAPQPHRQHRLLRSQLLQPLQLRQWRSTRAKTHKMKEEHEGKGKGEGKGKEKGKGKGQGKGHGHGKKHGLDRAEKRPGTWKAWP